MPTTNKAVRKLESELAAYQKAQRAAQSETKQVGLDAKQEKAELATISARENKIIDEFENPKQPLDDATQKKLLGELFALGQKSVQVQDHFTALEGKARQLASKDAAAAKADKAQALKDLKPAEYQMNLAQTNAARKALGLKAVKTVIRPPRPHNRIYVVRSGDTLAGIASKFHTTLARLERANPQIHDPNSISVGERITIPGGSGGRPPPVHGGKNGAEVARQFLGWSEYKLEPSGKLDMHTWVPKDVDCANFVSGCLEKAGLIPASAHSDYVTGLRDNLEARGWKPTALKNAKPGDVVCFDGPDGPFQHVEIFDHWQGNTPVFIGSNNVMPDGTQKITYDVGGTWAYRFHVYAPPK